MNRYETLKAATAETIEPLARTVQTLEKRLATIGGRIADTRVEVERKEKALADHRETAGEKLSASTSDFSAWQGRLRRLTREHETLVEALALLENDLRPMTLQKLADARAALGKALNTLRGAAKPEAEKKLAVLLDALIAEHDAHLAAWTRLYREHGASYSPVLGLDPTARSTRLDKVAHTPTGRRWLTFFPPPVVEAPPVAVAPAAVPEAPQARNPYQDDPQTPQDAAGATTTAPPDTQDAQDAPQATATPAPDDGGLLPPMDEHADGRDTAPQDAVKVVADYDPLT